MDFNFSGATDTRIEVRELGEKVKEGRRRKDGVWICEFCSKEFDSGKALGGHMRIHKKKASGADDFSRKRRVLDLEGEEQLTCLLCGKTFSSHKQIYGHMRLHPGRPYRGMVPPDSGSAETTPCSTIDSDHPPQEMEESSSPGVDLVRCLDDVNWPVKKSRSCKNAAAIDSEMTEYEIGAALALMLLANGDDEIRSAKKRKKVADQSPKSYNCNICSKSYPTPQALGGHKSSAHKPVAMSVSVLESGGLGMLKPHKPHNGDEEDIVAATPLITHICKFCNKPFPSGQALGGHMRCHWLGPAPGSAATTAKEPAELGFDLNELPEVDDGHC